MTGPNWQQHERDVQEVLGLASTSGSGNKWFDQSDGTHKGHYSQHRYALMVDCKSTLKYGYTVGRRTMRQWVKTAGEDGKIFGLPIRFEYESGKYEDYIVIELSHYAELREEMKPETIVEKKPRSQEFQQAMWQLEDMSEWVKDPDLKLKLLGMVKAMEEQVPE